MNDNSYKKKRVAHLIISTICTLLAILFLTTPLLLKILCLIFGIGLGYYLGKLDWQMVKKRIDKRNVVILYFTDSGFYAIFFILAIMHFFPLSIDSFLRITKEIPYVFSFLIHFVVFCWVAYNYVIWREVRSFEKLKGILIARQFWSRSMTGEEGMISKEGIVIKKRTYHP